MDDQQIAETKYYIDEAGVYLGGFGGVNVKIPEGAIEVPEPPPHAWQKYDRANSVWLPLTEDDMALMNA